MPPLTAGPEVAPVASSKESAATRGIFVVDDHPIFRAGLTQLIQSEPGLSVCGEAANAPQALAALRTTPADMAVVDVSLPGANGIELIKQLRAEHPRLPLLVISAYDEGLYALRALRAGAGGYLMKRESGEHFLAAVRKVLAGEVWVSPSFGEQLIYKVARGQETGAGTPLDVLTDREIEVLQLVGQAKSSQEIADLLHLSVKTVESHRLHIKEKLGLKNATELVRFAVDWVNQQGA
jgi:DNA-binding NarL/FixJ family response regulator